MTTSRKNPWWQATKTQRQGFLFGRAWAVLALGQWIILAIDPDPSTVGVLSALLFTPMAAVYLGSAVLLRRRRQGTIEPDGGVRAGQSETRPLSS